MSGAFCKMCGGSGVINMANRGEGKVLDDCYQCNGEDRELWIAWQQKERIRKNAEAEAKGEPKVYLF